MTNFVYFISTTYLKDNTPLNENVDDKLLKSAIKEAQEIYVRDVIGSGIRWNIDSIEYNPFGLVHRTLFEILHVDRSNASYDL